ncbi:TetR/AcrR family transcriptional regulator [Pseudomonas sp. MAFF 301449]|uniref:TetR/AcrR family transcriptional regulator n=1 Tax=Pseudomonas cyclaminis TaxID=2781239 RepID=A0ABR9SRM2_9PSED|nr:TetR/AcrR family transcriptional regulator [Pseudomonas cyclaminis]MBE8591551.1 TetR/AcrR family transcriptional regulator [Pseudomonas cyclaminis]MBE8598641.1 TetR/AcrR family transcriptional regulator [Pseudomonas cyclaminis]
MKQATRQQKTGARGRPSLPFDKIISTALETVEEVGHQVFNMRMLADRLESGTATLYRHFESKDEIFAFVADRFLGELLTDEPDYSHLTWQEACAFSTSRFYKLLSAHPNIVPLLVAQIPIGPNGLELRERLLAMFINAGFSFQLAASAYTTIAHYVLGFAGQLNPIGQNPQSADDELGEFFQLLDPSKFPVTIKIAPHLANSSINDEFHFGLKLIISGLEHTLSHA